jgi:CubicO group peptidase (beta-lactamase class C family)
MSYDIFNPILQKWRASQGHVMGSGATVMERHNCPLLYEPGTSWEYSPSVDWAGKMVERVNDNITLEDYMRIHIWEPLGIKDMTFFFKKRPDLRKRMVDCSLRDPSSGKATYMPDPKWYDGHLVDAMGGGGCFATPREYFKVIKAVLHNDGTLLKQKIMDELFKPQLGEASRKTLQGFMDNPEMTGLQGGLPLGTKIDWSLTGCLVLDDIPGWRRKYALNWGGMPNLHWVSEASLFLGTS